MVWFWNFVLYSFFGFLLEVSYARAAGERRDRKCLLLLPLCPVYGLGACAILTLAPRAGGSAVQLFFLGAAAATAVEYLLALWYELGLGVAFWDYSNLPWNVQGRVCLSFSGIWGMLAVALVRGVHPAVEGYLRAIPLPVTAMWMALVGADLLISGMMMKRTGDRTCLQWYRKKEP